MAEWISRGEKSRERRNKREENKGEREGPAWDQKPGSCCQPDIETAGKEDIQKERQNVDKETD